MQSQRQPPGKLKKKRKRRSGQAQLFATLVCSFTTCPVHVRALASTQRTVGLSVRRSSWCLLGTAIATSSLRRTALRHHARCKNVPFGGSFPTSGEAVLYTHYTQIYMQSHFIRIH